MNNNDLAKIRTKLANQRTYLAYMRTGFAISALAGSFKKKYLVLFGIVMIILSTIQYYLLNVSINNDDKLKNMEYYNLIPLIYIILSLIILYLQYKK